MKFSRLIAIALTGFALYQYMQHRPVDPGRGVVAPQAPVQHDTWLQAFAYKDFSIQPLAEFSTEARVLSSEHYRWDAEAALTPVDLALGWGRMSDTEVLKHIQILQGGRWYHWHAERLPIPYEEIVRSSANMHMIPANDVIDRQLHAIRTGQIVRIRGWLVEARSSDGWYQRSSLTRDDTGAGACELVFVRDLEIR
jgi:hypothetical protein